MFSKNLSYVLLFVENPPKSAEFYGNLFNLKPVELQPTFAMFALPNGVMLGLWSRYTAEPIVTAQPGSSEICFATEDVDALYQAWGNQNITMIQKPVDLDFGRTFVAIDPDGHRIRAYKLHRTRN